MTEAGKILNDVSKRLALMELACISLAHKDILDCVFSVKKDNWGVADYAATLSNFLGETLELTMECMTELDKLEDTLQCNVQESSEKKGA